MPKRPEDRLFAAAITSRKSGKSIGCGIDIEDLEETLNFGGAGPAPHPARRAAGRNAARTRHDGRQAIRPRLAPARAPVCAAQDEPILNSKFLLRAVSIFPLAWKFRRARSPSG